MDSSSRTSIDLKLTLVLLGGAFGQTPSNTTSLFGAPPATGFGVTGAFGPTRSGSTTRSTATNMFGQPSTNTTGAFGNTGIFGNKPAFGTSKNALLIAPIYVLTSLKLLDHSTALGRRHNLRQRQGSSSAKLRPQRSLLNLRLVVAPALLDPPGRVSVRLARDNNSNHSSSLKEPHLVHLAKLGHSNQPVAPALVVSVRLLLNYSIYPRLSKEAIDPPVTTGMEPPRFLLDALNDSISSGTFIDTKFYVFSRREPSGRVSSPRALFCNAQILDAIPYFSSCK